MPNSCGQSAPRTRRGPPSPRRAARLENFATSASLRTSPSAHEHQPDLVAPREKQRSGSSPPQAAGFDGPLAEGSVRRSCAGGGSAALRSAAEACEACCHAPSWRRFFFFSAPAPSPPRAFFSTSFCRAGRAHLAAPPSATSAPPPAFHRRPSRQSMRTMAPFFSQVGLRHPECGQHREAAARGDQRDRFALIRRFASASRTASASNWISSSRTETSVVPGPPGGISTVWTARTKGLVRIRSSLRELANARAVFWKRRPFSVARQPGHPSPPSSAMPCVSRAPWTVLRKLGTRTIAPARPEMSRAERALPARNPALQICSGLTAASRGARLRTARCHVASGGRCPAIRGVPSPGRRTAAPKPGEAPPRPASSAA
jgi:hypothetical protein